jgi:hypothetical protein
VTVFSAPRYNVETNNMGAVMLIDKNMKASFRLIYAPKNPKDACEKGFRQLYSEVNTDDWGYASRQFIEVS